VLTTSELYDAAALATLIASATDLGADLKVGLNLAVVSPTKKLVVGDMVEPTFTSYARTAVVMGAPFRDDANGICSLGGPVTFQMTGTPVPCLVQGIFFMSGTTSAVFMGYEPLAVPFQMNDDLDQLTLTLQYIQSSLRQGFNIVIT